MAMVPPSWRLPAAIILIACPIGGSLASEPADDSWRQHLEAATAAQARGELAIAERELRLAIDRARRVEPLGVGVTSSAQALARVLADQKNFAEAAGVLDQALDAL